MDQQITELNNEFNSKFEEYDNNIHSLKNVINDKRNEITALTELNLNLTSNSDSIITENKKLNKLLKQKNCNLTESTNELKSLKKKMKLLKNSFDEKNNNIHLLKSEIEILEATINEKDKTINSLRKQVN